MTRDMFDSSAGTVQTALMPAPDPAGTGDLLAELATCVGFADCPCHRCRSDRRAANLAHPNHAPGTDRAYCEPCRRASR